MNFTVKFIELQDRLTKSKQRPTLIISTNLRKSSFFSHYYYPRIFICSTSKLAQIFFPLLEINTKTRNSSSVSIIRLDHQGINSSWPKKSDQNIWTTSKRIQWHRSWHCPQFPSFFSRDWHSCIIWSNLHRILVPMNVYINPQFINRPCHSGFRSWISWVIILV